ncbi:WYL domain-containing protein [bacterium]|nr:WYL domain-containing protein [bacterium]
MEKGDRYAGVGEIINLAVELMKRSQGMTLNEIQKFYGNCSRSTAERRRDCLRKCDLGITELPPATGSLEKRWGFSSIDAQSRNFIRITAEDVANVKKASKKVSQADKLLLKDTISKLEAICKSKKQSADDEIEDILRTEFVVNKQKANYKVDAVVLKRLIEGIRGSYKTKLKYTKKGVTTQRTLLPLGLVSKDKTYLIARKDGDAEDKIATYSLHKISDVHVTIQQFDRKGFDLKEYSNRSFGVWQDDNPMNVELLFSKAVAEDVECYKFHPSQKFIKQKDGSIKVQFTAGGKREIIWHLFTWGDNVKIIKPKELKDEYKSYIDSVLKTL